MGEIETRYGSLAVLDVENDLIGRFLARYGEWAWLETVFVSSVLSGKMRVLDAGAYLGTFGLGLAKLGDVSFLCCVEGNPTVAEMLQSNVVRQFNGPSVVVPAVLAARSDAMMQPVVEVGNAGGLSFVEKACPNCGGSPASPTTTIARLFAEHGTFDLVKLDIEGMEYEVLEGGAEQLSGGDCTLWIECNETEASIEMARLVLSWNLSVFYFAFPSHNPANYNGAEEAIFPWAFEAGLLVAPRTAPELAPDLAAVGCILVPIQTPDALRAAMWRTPRWGRAEWQHAATASELAALVGHALLGQTEDTFLQHGAGTATLWQQRDAALDLLEAERTRARHLETELARVSARALAHLASIGEVRDEAARQQAGSQRLAREALQVVADREAEFDRLQQALQREMEAQVQAEREALHHERARTAELMAAQQQAATAQLDQQRSLAAQADAARALIEASTFWRATAPLRHVVARIRRRGRAT